MHQPIDLEDYRRSVWDMSGSQTISARTDYNEFFKLRCPLLRQGVHKFKIFINKMDEDDYIAIGVESFQCAWNYDNEGCTTTTIRYYQEEGQRFSGFESDSTISFELDLTRGGGTFSASVDDGQKNELFTNMLSALKSEDDSFVPFVSLSKPSKVTFLGFEDNTQE